MQPMFPSVCSSCSSRSCWVTGCCKLGPKITGFQIAKDVSTLRLDHVSIEGKLLGMREALHSGGVLDFKEMNRRLIRS
jgi:hypothetical protein